MRTDILVVAIILAITFASPVHALYFNDSLIAYWSFDNGSLSNAAGLNSSLPISGTTYNTTGIILDARNFTGNGTNTTTVRGYLNAVPQFSFSIWVRPNQTSDFRMLAVSRNGTNVQFDLEQNATDTIVFTVYNSSYSTCFLESTANLSQNAWTHVAATYNGSDDGNISVFLNGTLSATKKCGSNYTTLASMLGSADTLRIGWNDPVAPTQNFTGALDEISLYNRTLNNIEISRMWNSSAAFPYPFSLATITAPVNTTYAAGSIPINVTLNSNFTCNVSDNGTLIHVNTGSEVYTNTTTKAIGYHNLSLSCNYSALAWNSTVYYSVLNGNQINLTSSLGWTAFSGQTDTLSCTAEAGTPNLYVQSVGVSNPYTFPLSTGSYSVVCNTTGDATHVSNTTSASLTVSSQPSCFNSTTYAFVVNISTATNITTLNFTTLVTSHLVKSNLTDVYIPAISTVSKNLTGENGQYLVVNNTGSTWFLVYFGNYPNNNNYTYNASINNTQNVTTYSQANTYMVVNLIDEINGTNAYPVSSDVLGAVTCSLGQNYFDITANDSYVLVATVVAPTKIMTRATYTATDFYSRSRYPDSIASIYNINMYMPDMTRYPVDPVQFIMQDVDKQGDLLQIYKVIGNNTVFMTEGYFDASASVVLYLMEDVDYFARTKDASGNYHNFGIINVPGATTKYLYTSMMNLTPPSGSYAQNITILPYFNNSSAVTTPLILNWSDSSGGLANITLIVYNNTGVVNTTTFSSVNNFSSVVAYSANTSQNYYLKLTVRHSIFGSFSEGRIVNGNFTDFSMGFGSGTLFIFAVAIILIVMLSMGSPITIIPTGIVVFALWGMFSYMGWLALDSGQMTVLILLLIVGMGVAYFARGER